MSGLTLKKLETSINTFQRYTGVHPSKADSSTVRSFIRLIKEDGKKNSYINSILRSLGPEFNLKYEPLKEPSLIPKAQNYEAMDKSVQDLDKGTEKTCLLILLDCGLRAQELLDLRFSDRDGDFLLVTGKFSKERMVPATKRVVSAIRNLEKNSNSDYIASSIKGKRRSYAWLNSLVKRVCGCSPHKLRHTIATALINNGASTLAISKILGHSSTNATQIYTSHNINNLKSIHDAGRTKRA